MRHGFPDCLEAREMNDPCKRSPPENRLEICWMTDIAFHNLQLLISSSAGRHCC